MKTNKTYLLIDCNFMCHRAKHTTKGLSYKNKHTGAIYGFLNSLITLSVKFRTNNFIFCWDSKTSARKKIYPKYKANRNKHYQAMSKQDRNFEDNFRKQMILLRKEYLKQIGFCNIFCQKGREADDMIGSICAYNIKRKDRAIIITADKDMYQLLTPKISLFNPISHKMMTDEKFRNKYQIEPHEWTLVKALAGCSTDNIEGVKGVGEITALKHLRSQLTEGCKAQRDILAPWNIILAQNNFELVELPMRETKKFKIKQDKLSASGWKEVMKSLGMKSLKTKMPFRIK